MLFRSFQISGAQGRGETIWDCSIWMVMESPKDYVQAYMWFSLAGESNPNLPFAKDHMTADQILEAERLVVEWKSRHTISKPS